MSENKTVGFRPHKGLRSRIAKYAEEEGLSMGGAVKQLTIIALTNLGRWPISAPANQDGEMNP